MSLIEQARELVKGFVSTDVDPVTPLVDPLRLVDPARDRLRDRSLEHGDAERIRQEWDAQPHHP